MLMYTGPERDSTSTCREYSKERQCEFRKALKRRVLQGGKGVGEEKEEWRPSHNLINPL